MSFLETRHGLGIMVIAGALALGGEAVAQTKAIPDAQVDANVLRQLATASELSTQNIQSSTVYGTVTLTGTVQTEALRTKAENLAAHADGVKKVVDELTLGDPGVATATNDPAEAADQSNTAQSQYAQGETTYPQQAPYPPQANVPPSSNRTYGAVTPTYNQPSYSDNSQQDAGQQPPYAPGAPEYGRQTPYSSQSSSPQTYSSQPYPPQRRPLYSNGYAAPAPYPGASYPGNGAGQQGGQVVTVAPGAVIQVRINRGIDSNHIQPGTPFDGVILNDVFAGGAVAIPRGASVQGTVIDAAKAGALKGRGELSLQINNLMLGGQNYPLLSAPWEREGSDKTGRTVNSALGLGALGAIFGGLAGGGAGAAIGAGVGAGVGVAGSAASPGGRVIVPPESVLTFHLAQPTTVTTVSQQEMARLSYAAGPNPAVVAPVRRRYYSPYGSYYGPGPAPGYYRQY